MFPQKDIYQLKWIAPNVIYKNQIDYIIINNRFENCIKNIRTLRGADTYSNHLMVGCWMKVKLKRMTNGKLTKKNIYNTDNSVIKVYMKNTSTR